MNIKATLDSRAFERDLKALLPHVRKDAQKVLEEQAKLLLKDCVLMTPPFGEHPLSESFASQKRLGDRAVSRDITGRTFVGISKLNMFAADGRLPKELRKLLRAGDVDGLQETLSKVLKKNVVVVSEADESYHQNQRKHGRVPKKTISAIVMRERSIAGYLRKVLGHVGKAKAGWVEAAAGLGLKLPAWITRHSSSGLFKKEFGAFRNVITIGNLVPWIQAKGRDLKIIEVALSRRSRSLQARLERILKARMQP